MTVLDRFKQGQLHLTRIEAFSDAVFAIVVTLLVLIGPASYLVGAAAAWVNIHAALVVYLLTPLFYITPPTWHGSTRDNTAAEKK